MSKVIDENTGLYLNAPNVWSKSPYLGAVKFATNENYVANAYVTVAVFEEVINSQLGKWAMSEMPDSCKNPDSTLRSKITFGSFVDPRQAAWAAQQFLENPAEMVESLYEKMYFGSQTPINDVLADLIEEAKSQQFDGPIFEEKDKGIYSKLLEKQEAEARQVVNIKSFYERDFENIKKEYIKLASDFSLKSLLFDNGSITKEGIIELCDRYKTVHGHSAFYETKDGKPTIKRKKLVDIDLLKV